MQCREIKELLSPYLDGMLNPSEGEEISAHLAVCPDCQAEWHALCEVVDLFKTLPEMAPPPEFSAQVMNKIAASPLPARKKSGTAAIFRNLTRGHWSRAFALAATVVLTVGVTALMYGAPGQWGSKTPFLSKPPINDSISQDNPENGDNERPESPGAKRPSIGILNPSGYTGDGRTDIAIDGMPDRLVEPDPGTQPVTSPPESARPEQSGVQKDSSNGQDTKYRDQLKNLLDEQARGDNWLPSSPRALVAPQTMAVKEGAISQQAAFGYIPVSNNESRKMIRSASLGLTADDPVGAPARIADIARNNGGYLLTEGSGKGAITMKVPVDQFNQVVNLIQGLGRSTLRQIGGEDVSERYSDYEARIRDLAAEEQRLLTAVDSAGSATDVRAAQARLTRVHEDLERQKKLLGSLSNEVELATIKISLE